MGSNPIGRTRLDVPEDTECSRNRSKRKAAPVFFLRGFPVIAVLERGTSDQRFSYRFSSFLREGGFEDQKPVYRNIFLLDRHLRKHLEIVGNGNGQGAG